MKQKLLWMPPTPEGEIRTPPVRYRRRRPARLWTLYKETDEKHPPTLPYTPQHLVNAFLEDYVHDWSIGKGALHYYSRVSSGGTWLLLEWNN